MSKTKLEKIKLFSIIILSIVILAIAVPKALAVSGKLNEGNIRVREQANTTSKVLKNLYKTDGVEILGKTGEWYKIKSDNVIGYMKQEFIDITKGKAEDIPNIDGNNSSSKPVQEPEKPKQEESSTPKVEQKEIEKQEVVIKADVEAKTYPVIYALKVFDVKKEEKLEKISEIGKWIQVSKDGKQAWIPKALTE